jgi:dipeptidyl aminopeptidase/acylaminoacyl peptidase
MLHARYRGRCSCARLIFCQPVLRYLTGYLALLVFAFALPAHAQTVPLEEFAKLPLFDDIKISPTGKYLAATVRDNNDRQSMVFMDLRTNEVATVIKGRKRDRVVNYVWANDERVVIWLGRKVGTLDSPVETDMVTAVNWDGKQREWLLGSQKEGNASFNRVFRVARLLHRLPDDDENILITVRNAAQRDGSFTEILKLNIYNGMTRRVDKAPMRGADVIADNDGNVRLSIATDPDKENAVVIHELRDLEWHLLGEYDSRQGDVTPIGYTPDNSLLYVLDNRATDTDALYLYNSESQEQELLYHHPLVDIEDVERAPDGDIVGIYLEPDFPEYVPFNVGHPWSKSLTMVHEALRGYRVEPTSITTDGRLAIIKASSDRLPARYFLLNTAENRLTSIVSVMPGLEEAKMRPVEPYALNVRDGTTVYAYLTKPDDSHGPFPMVVMPHGGPHGVRDYWSFDSYAQMMASRGYAVLQMNFRGSGGYGRSFLYEGYRHWGTTMQDDVTDVTQWAIDSGIAREDGVCIFGGSYGGYAAMMGAIREPDLYKCVIAYVGVYDLELMFKKGDIPRRKSGRVFLRQAVGVDEEDLRARSPVHNLDKLKAPVFIVHGGEDFRVDIAHAHKLRKGLEKLDKPYEWLVKPNEAHGFYLPENRLELFERMLAFLDEHIGHAKVGDKSVVQN